MKFTDAATMPDDIKMKLLRLRDALVKNKLQDAYRILYSIVDPKYEKRDPWECLEVDKA